jgi:hypothetical protein
VHIALPLRLEIRHRLLACRRGCRRNPGWQLNVGLHVLAQNWSREMPQVENDKIVETATEARGAVTGQNVNYVLLVSTIAVIVLFVIAYLLMKG